MGDGGKRRRRRRRRRRREARTLLSSNYSTHHRCVPLLFACFRNGGAHVRIFQRHHHRVLHNPDCLARRSVRCHLLSHGAHEEALAQVRISSTWTAHPRFSPPRAVPRARVIAARLDKEQRKKRENKKARQGIQWEMPPEGGCRRSAGSV